MINSKRKTRALVAGIAFLALTVSACGSSDKHASGSDTKAAGKKTYTIGIANQIESVTFPAAMKKGAEAEAKKLGNVKIVDLSNGGKDDVQAQNVQTLINQKVDAIILVPNSPTVAMPLVAQAKAAGIPIATLHGYSGSTLAALSKPDPNLKFIIDEDEVGAGELAGQMALKAAPNGGEVGVVTGAAGYIENTTRVQKFKSVLAAADAKYTVVGTQPGAWTKDGGQTACQGILSAHPDTALFYAISDDMAVGCAAAIKAKGSKAKVIGLGGSAGGISGIKDGSIYGTLCDTPADNAALAVSKMVDVLDGKLKGAPATTFVPFKAITSDNTDECVPQW